MKDLAASGFTFERTMEILRQTPETLQCLTGGLADFWTTQNEGQETWSVYDVVGHLIHGEKTDWMARVNIILSNANDRKFAPFDRFAQFESSKGKTLGQLLTEFETVRAENIDKLTSLQLTDTDLTKTGIHPVFGPVTLRQLLATWAVHDLDHISQIVRVMAKQYKEETGPWIEFLRILRS